MVVDRAAADRLPGVCPLSGELATHRIPCVFHKQQGFLSGGPSPVGLLLELIQYYLLRVDKALLWIPLAPRLYRRWWLGWGLMAIATVATLATMAGLWFGQQAIQAMPKGDNQKFWNDLGIPLIAFGGFTVVAICALAAHKIMPMPIVQLKLVDVAAHQLYLRGASAKYLEALENRSEHGTERLGRISSPAG